jgi:hypothetical protein
MNFYFCETCGKRITEIDIQKGAGKDKKFKGVYCDKCAVGVMTMETLAISDMQAREVLKSHDEQPASAPATHAVSTAKAARHTKTIRPPSSDSKTMPIVAAGGAVLVIIGIIIATQLGGTPPAAPRAKTPETTAILQQPETPKENPAPQPSKLEQQPVAEVPKPDPGPVETTRQPAPANDAEGLAQAEYEKLMKALDGLDKADTKGRIDLAEAFLKDHRDTIVASRVSVMLNAWKTPQEQPAAVAQTTPAPSDPIAAATAPTPPASLENGFTFDRKRGGNWRKDMGKDGYVLFNGNGAGKHDTKLPSHITSVTCDGGMHYDWNVSDERALEDPVGTRRFIHAEYGAYMTINIAATNDQPYRVSLYAIDGASNLRRQRLDVVPQNGPKRSVEMTDMANGCWVSFNATGSQKLSITRAEGVNAVLLAVLFDPIAGAPAAGPRDDYTLDRKRGGTWMNELGRDGYIIFSRPVPGKHEEKLPPYIQRVTPNGARSYIHSHKDRRVLDAGPGEKRHMGVLYADRKFEVNIDAADQTPCRLSIYLFDVAFGRKTRVEVIAAKKTIYSVDIDRMEEGCWLQLETAGSVQLVFTRLGEHNVSVCGLFWDPIPGRTAAGTVPAPETPPPAEQPPGPEKTLARATWEEFKGGAVLQNFWQQKKTSRMIWGQKSTRHTMTAQVTLAAAASDATFVVHSLRHEKKEACLVAFRINGREIFNGRDPATKWVWADHRFKIPDGTLKAGANDIAIENMEPEGKDSTLPWYMIHQVEIRTPEAKK